MSGMHQILPVPSARASSQPSHTGVDERLCRIVFGIVAAGFGVAEQDLRAPGRGAAPVAFARQVAVYLGHVVFGMNLTRLGRAFGRDRTTARHACRTIEDSRDDPAIDRFIGLLEAACAAAAAARHPGLRVHP